MAVDKNRRTHKEFRREGFTMSKSDDHWLGQVARQVGFARYIKYEKNSDPDKMHLVAANTCDASAPLWTNVTVGHWLVCMTGKLDGRLTYACISKCRVIAFYEAWEIAQGRLPKTCHACNPTKNPPPTTRVLPDSVMGDLEKFWEEDDVTTAFDENSRLIGKDHIRAWDQAGRPFIADVCARAGYGRTFGWKVYVNRATSRSDTASDKPSARVRAIHKNAKKIEIVMQPASCDYQFEIDLATGRSDVVFWDVATRIKEIIEFVCPPKAPAAPPVAAAASGPTNGHVNIIDLAKLSKLMGNLQKVAKIGDDVNEIATLKLAVQQKISVLQEKKNAAYTRSVAAEEEARAAKLKVDAHQERVRDFENKMRIELQLRDQAAAELATKTTALGTAKNEFVPLEEAVASAEKELAEYEAIEADHIKSIGDAKGLQALLQALAAIPG